MSCEPRYDYRPCCFVGSDAPSVAPGFHEHRSRLFAGGTFFRSIRQGTIRNSIALEVVIGGFPNVTLNVYFQGVLSETFQINQIITPPTVTPPDPGGCDGIAKLRAAVNNAVTGSKLIEMTFRGFDFFDNGADDSDDCVTAFAITNMRGGAGEPDPVFERPFIDAIRTGPSRTIIIIRTTENITGFPITPPTSRRVKQFDGTKWVLYSNLVQGQCPVDGS